MYELFISSINRTISCDQLKITTVIWSIFSMWNFLFRTPVAATRCNFCCAKVATSKSHVLVRFVAAISQGFRNLMQFCCDKNCTAGIAATKIACVNGPLPPSDWLLNPHKWQMTIMFKTLMAHNKFISSYMSVTHWATVHLYLNYCSFQKSLNPFADGEPLDFSNVKFFLPSFANWQQVREAGRKPPVITHLHYNFRSSSVKQRATNKDILLYL